MHVRRVSEHIQLEMLLFSATSADQKLRVPFVFTTISLALSETELFKGTKERQVL